MVYFLFFYMIFNLIFFKKIRLNLIFLIFFNVFYLKFNFKSNLIFFLTKLRVLTSTLTNGLFLIHPLLLYMSYSLIILFFFKRLNKNYISFEFGKNLTTLSLLALILGGWWAQQELNWNGWWGWDFVEILGLVSFLIILANLHLEKNSALSPKTTFVAVTTVVILVLSTKLGAVNSIHAFTTTSSIESFVFLSFWLIGFFFFFKKSFFLKKFTYVNTLFVYFVWLFLFINIYWFFYLTLLTSEFLLVDLFKNLSLTLILLIYLFLNYEAQIAAIFMFEFWILLFLQCLNKLKRWDYHFYIFLFLISTKYIYVNFCGLKEADSLFFLQLKLSNYMNFCTKTFDFLFFKLDDYFFLVKKKNFLKNFDIVYSQNYYKLNFIYYFFQSNKLILIFNFINVVIFFFFFYFLIKKVFIFDIFKKNNLN